jgi:Poxvirus A32 protein
MNVTKNTFKIEPLPWKTKKLVKDIPDVLPKPGTICWTMVARRSSGKTLHLINLVKAYSRSVNAIIILSPTINLDKKWDAVKEYKNVLVGDQISNETLLSILQKQKEAYDPKKPQDCQILLVIDDFGALFRRKEIRHAMNILYQTCRHYGCNLITACQSIMHLESAMISNSVQWTIWQVNKRALKKICNDLATATMDEDALEKFVNDNTKEPYAWVFIDYLKDPSEVFWIKYDKTYSTSND